MVVDLSLEQATLKELPEGNSYAALGAGRPWYMFGVSSGVYERRACRICWGGRAVSRRWAQRDQILAKCASVLWGGSMADTALVEKSVVFVEDPKMLESPPNEPNSPNPLDTLR